MKWKFCFMALLLATPWLLTATPGSIAELGAWLASSVALAVLLSFQQARSWKLSLLLASLVSAGFGLLQFWGLATSTSSWLSESASGEMVANLRQRNQLASLLVMGVLSLWSLQSQLKTTRWLIRLGLAGCIIFFLAFANALSGSRTGLLQFLAVSILAVFWWRTWRSEAWWLLGVAWLSYLLGIFIAPWFADLAGHANAGLLGRAGDANAFSRIALWSNVIELITREPLLGHGWRSLAYAHYSSEFSGVRFMELLDNAHNLPLHLAVELGLPVAFAFCVLVAWTVWRGKPWAEARADRQMAWGILLVIGIHSMLEYPLWYGPFFLTALLCLWMLLQDHAHGLWQIFIQNRPLAQQIRARTAMKLGVMGIALMLLGATVFVAFDYHRVSQIYLQPEERSSWYADDALGAAQKSVLFKSHAKFAELVITPLSRETAPRVLELSSELIHWSPEPRVIEKLIESSVMLGVDDLAAFHLKRYAKAYPQAHAAWAARSGQLPS